MVEWKGEITREESGAKAHQLDSIENLNVLNFFTITRTEIQELVGDSSPEEIVNTEFSGETWKNVETAYEEIGMSSEVRNASGEARNLVGGQRDGQRVSVRISSERRGAFRYDLDVGPSKLEDAVKQVITSYYQVETHHDHPAVLVQQMAEPGYSGAAITNYLGNYGLIEAVKGLGASIDEGATIPAIYLMDDGVQDKRIPEQQVVVERNKMNGDHEKKTARPEPPFSDEELEQFFRQVETEEASVKFVYKRGSFYVVDAFEPSKTNPFSVTEASLQGIRVSEGEIDGTVGENIKYSDETILPDENIEALIARKGGYTSTHAQVARQNDMPAIFNFNGELEHGQHISLGSTEIAVGDEDTKHTGSTLRIPETASDILPVNSGNGIYLSPPFARARYAVTDQESRAETVPLSGHLTSYAEIFAFDGEKAVLDARELEPRGLENAIEYLDAELKILLVNYPEPRIIRKAIESGFNVFGTSGDTESLEAVVEREERRFMLEQMRELSK